MEFDQGKVKQVYEILKDHKGTKQAITSGEIAKMVGIEPGASKIRIRQYIREVLRQFKLPLGAHSNGYFLIETKEELFKYIQGLNSRITEIQQRITEVYSNYMQFVEGIELELTSEKTEPYEFDI